MVVEDWNSPDLFSIAVISPSMCSRRRSNSFAKSDSGVPGVDSSSRDLRCVVVRLVIVVLCPERVLRWDFSYFKTEVTITGAGT